MAKKSNKPAPRQAEATKTKEKETFSSRLQNRTKDAQKRRKRQTNRQNSGKKEKKGGLREYFKGVKLEMKKVVWPTRSELGAYPVIVLCTCAAFALLFWGVDSGVLAAIQAIFF